MSSLHEVHKMIIKMARRIQPHDASLKLVMNGSKAELFGKFNCASLVQYDPYFKKVKWNSFIFSKTPDWTKNVTCHKVFEMWLALQQWICSCCMWTNELQGLWGMHNWKKCICKICV